MMTENAAKSFVCKGGYNLSVDNQVYHDIIKTFAKETICLSPLGFMTKTNVHDSIIKKIEYSEYEISPFHKHDISCDEQTTSSFYRQPSIAKFSKRKIDLAILKQTLVNSFAVDAEQRRPYPSGGALYPIEALVFIFKERVSGFDNHIPGCYHFRPVSKKLQFISELPFDWFYETLMQNYLNIENAPAFGVLYMAHIGKALFKYRYRGYRHALIEVGAMCQMASFASQELGLRNTIWSTFGEYQLMQKLNLNNAQFMPFMMQFFGYAEES